MVAQLLDTRPWRGMCGENASSSKPRSFFSKTLVSAKATSQSLLAIGLLHPFSHLLQPAFKTQDLLLCSWPKNRYIVWRISPGTAQMCLSLADAPLTGKSLNPGRPCAGLPACRRRLLSTPSLGRRGRGPHLHL